MSIYYSKAIKDIKPYVPGEQPKDKKYIKLNTNECPYPPSYQVKKAIADFDYSDLRLYSDPDASELKLAIANFNGVDANQVFVGNGSDEVLAMAFMAFFDIDREIKFPDISYSFYKVYANLFNIPVQLVELNDDFTIPIEKMCDSIGGVIFPNPNAPTGIALELNDIELILKNNAGKVVIVDEAYVDFGAKSALELLSKYDNLLVVQTFSKSRALAGARIGYAIGSKELISGLEMVKNSFNSYTLDRLAQIIAIKSIEDKVYNMTIQKQIIETRKWTENELNKLGFTTLPSKSNFVFATHKELKAEYIFKYLRENGVLVRYFNQPRIDNFLRITIGTKEEMEKMVEILKKL